MMNTKLTVQEMAEATGLSKDTLRYYEKIGLIENVERASNGHRRYSESDVDWVAFLKRMRAIGMSIQQMLHYAELRRQGDSTITQRRRLLEAHETEIEKTIQVYQQLQVFIAEKIEIYKQMEREIDDREHNPL